MLRRWASSRLTAARFSDSWFGAPFDGRGAHFCCLNGVCRGLEFVEKVVCRSGCMQGLRENWIRQLKRGRKPQISRQKQISVCPFSMSSDPKKKEIGWASPGSPDPRTLARTWGTPTEWLQPQRRTRLVPSFTCRAAIEFAGDDKFV
jgi:hypothetical protein